jgi:hypothetical protein
VLLLPGLAIYAAASLVIGAVLLLLLLAVTGAIFGNLNIGYFLGWVGRGFGLMAVLVAVDAAAGLLLPPGLSPLVLNFVFQVCLLTAGLMIVFRVPGWHAAVVALFTVFLWSLARLAVAFFLAAALTASV